MEVLAIVPTHLWHCSMSTIVDDVVVTVVEILAVMKVDISNTPITALERLESTDMVVFMASNTSPFS